MSREQRARTAQETLEIIQQGSYRLRGELIDIGDAIRFSKANTVLYRPGPDFARLRNAAVANTNTMRSAEKRTLFETNNEGVLTTAARLAQQGKNVAVLNFASAKHPGGGFLKGAQAQEESLARGSAIYACVEPMRAFYQANGNCRTCLYTDHIIYSPNVPVFRSNNDQLVEPYQVSFITAPAVNAGAVAKNEPNQVSQIPVVMKARIAKILDVAIANGHNSLVLGAWGGGVFQNSPSEVANWFHTCLTDQTYANVFDVVAFAVLDPTFNEEIFTPFRRLFH